MAGIDTYTKLLLHGDGSNGGTTFTDETGKTVARVGSVVTSTAQKVFGTASINLTANSDALSLANNSDFDLSSGDFTVDFRMYVTTGGHICGRLQNGSPYAGYYMRVADLGAGTKIYLYTDNNTLRLTSSVTVSTSTWYHIAFVKNGGTITLYIDGTARGTWNGVLQNYETVFLVGAQIGGSSGMVGCVDEFRFSKGIARWTEAFTPPTEAYSADSSNIAHLKKLNGIAIANIKKINGVAIANVKKINGIA